MTNQPTNTPRKPLIFALYLAFAALLSACDKPQADKAAKPAVQATATAAAVSSAPATPSGEMPNITAEDMGNLARAMHGAASQQPDNAPKDKYGQPYIIGSLGGVPVNLPSSVVEFTRYDSFPNIEDMIKRYEFNILLRDIKRCISPKYKIKSLIYRGKFGLQLGREYNINEGMVKKISHHNDYKIISNFIKNLDISYLQNSSFYRNNMVISHIISINCNYHNYDIIFLSTNECLVNPHSYKCRGVGYISRNNIHYAFYKALFPVDSLTKILEQVFAREEVYSHYRSLGLMTWEDW